MFIEMDVRACIHLVIYLDNRNTKICFSNIFTEDV